MGLNYFASPNLESGKSPVDSKVHFTYKLLLFFYVIIQIEYFTLFQMLLYDMGLNYFASPNLESGKSPVDSKVHFTYTNRNDSTIFDSNGTLDEASVWEAYGDIMTNMALYHFIRFIFQIKTCWFKKKKKIFIPI